MIKRIVLLITIFISFNAHAEMSNIELLKSISPSAYEAAVYASKKLEMELTDLTVKEISKTEVFNKELMRLVKKDLLERFCDFNECKKG